MKIDINANTYVTDIEETRRENNVCTRAVDSPIEATTKTRRCFITFNGTQPTTLGKQNERRDVHKSGNTCMQHDRSATYIRVH